MGFGPPRFWSCASCLFPCIASRGDTEYPRFIICRVSVALWTQEVRLFQGGCQFAPGTCVFEGTAEIKALTSITQTLMMIGLRLCKPGLSALSPLQPGGRDGLSCQQGRNQSDLHTACRASPQASLNLSVLK